MPTATARIVGGRYRLGQQLGAGGTACVYRATDLRLDRDVAVKRFQASADPDAERRLQHETRLLGQLTHPGLVAALDAGIEPQSDAGPAGAWLVLELLEGPDLAALLRARGRLDSETVRAVVRDAAAALAYIHDRGVVHRDLKPANLLLTGEPGIDAVWRTKVADFGVARIVDGVGLTASGTAIGTAAYFSPEQTRMETVGTASDLYSLGLVALEALTGERAFPGSAVESATARLVCQPRIPGWITGSWAALLESMTAREPAARPSAAMVAKALSAPLPLLIPATAPPRRGHADQPTLPVTLTERRAPAARPAHGVAPARSARLRRAGIIGTALLIGAAVGTSGALLAAGSATPAPSSTVVVLATPVVTPAAKR